MKDEKKKFKSWRSFKDFVKNILYDSRFIYDCETTDFFDALIATSEKRTRWIDKGKILWRAQLGYDSEESIITGKTKSEEKRAYSSERMKPLNGKASEGRANPKGIPYLYLSDEKNTALSEVRPWIGSYISLSEFKILKKVKVIDCSVEHDKILRYYLNEPSSSQIINSIWGQIDKAFSRPVELNDNTADYVPTQILSELFKKNGFDGIIYKSHLGRGKNIILYDIELATVLTTALYEAKDIECTFNEVSKA